MNNSVEVLLATMHQKDMTFVNTMNIKTAVVAANQADSNSFVCDTVNGVPVKLLTTDTRGVGINRNLALALSSGDILLFADDDMVFYDDYEQKVQNAFEQLPDADVIFFSFHVSKENTDRNALLYKTSKLRLHQLMKFGAFCMAGRKEAILTNHISYSALVGGGCIYGSGEDSLFIMDCYKHGLSMYSHESILGINNYGESTWFKGYNEKYFYDKGAMTACFPGWLRAPFRAYLALRHRGLTELSCRTTFRLMNTGAKNYKNMISFEDWSKTSF